MAGRRGAVMLTSAGHRHSHGADLCALPWHSPSIWGDEEHHGLVASQPLPRQQGKAEVWVHVGSCWDTCATDCGLPSWSCQHLVGPASAGSSQGPHRSCLQVLCCSIWMRPLGNWGQTLTFLLRYSYSGGTCSLAGGCGNFMH